MEQASSEPIDRFRWAQIGIDAAIVFGSYLGALVLRFAGKVPDKYWQHFFRFVPVIILVHLLANYSMRLYDRTRLSTGKEAGRLVWAGLGTMLLLGFIAGFISEGVRPLPLSVLILGATVSVLGFELTRFGWRTRFRFPA